MDPIDIAELSDILGTSDPLVIRPILQVWLESSSTRIDAISNALGARDRTRLREAIHGAKGTALQIGAKKMAKICKQIENEISSAGWDVITGLVDQIFEEDNRTRCFAKKFLSGT